MEIDSLVEHYDGFTSKIVGIDYYTLKTPNKREVNWESFTLISEQKPPFDRWYLVNFMGYSGLDLHCFIQTEQLPDNCPAYKPLCCEVEIRSTGDNIMTSNSARLETYIKGNILYGVERFEDDKQLVMKGIPGRLEEGIFTPHL